MATIMIERKKTCENCKVGKLDTCPRCQRVTENGERHCGYCDWCETCGYGFGKPRPTKPWRNKSLTGWLVVVVLTSTTFAAELPDAPHVAMQPVIADTEVHNAPSFELPRRIVDKKFLTVHGIYLASIGFDIAETAILTVIAVLAMVPVGLFVKGVNRG